MSLLQKALGISDEDWYYLTEKLIPSLKGQARRAPLLFARMELLEKRLVNAYNTIGVLAAYTAKKDPEGWKEAVATWKIQREVERAKEKEFLLKRANQIAKELGGDTDFDISED